MNNVIKEAEAIVPNKIIKVATGKQSPSVVGECIVQNQKKRKTQKKKSLTPRVGFGKKKERQETKLGQAGSV